MARALRRKTTPVIMGILNVTPDSFSDGGKYRSVEEALDHARLMIDEGAEIIDIGGESTRPFSEPVAEKEELHRVIPVIERLHDIPGAFISVDTYKANVAREALKAGADMVNDISGLTHDDAMAGVIAEYDAHAVIMHIRGTPRNMQENPRYDDVIGEIRGFLHERVEYAVRSGVDREKIIVDPGIGFGKTLEDNYIILQNIREFGKLGFPVLVGLSRKSLIGKLYDREEDRLPATIALNAAALLGGADIIRVHDVREHRLALAGLEMLARVNRRDD